MSYGIYNIDSVLPLSNEEYFNHVSSLIRKASSRIWVMMFIVDIRLMRDPYLCVRHLCDELVYAKWRNVDVRLIVGTLGRTHDINFANLTSSLYLSKKGIPVRFFESKYKSSLHSKYIVADYDRILLGSHNWTHGGFFGHIEDSISVHSKPLNQILSMEFEENWKSSLTEENNAEEMVQ